MDTSAPPVPLEQLLGHHAWVRGLVRSLVRDPATADDVEQETWLAALRKPPADASTARAWLATVARNLIREKGRAGGRRSRREAAVARPEAVLDTASVVARAEQHKRVVLAVMDLEEPYRTTLLLRYFEDLPPREVARRMGAPVETVRTRQRRALALLRERFDTDARGDRKAWVAALAPLAAGGNAETEPEPEAESGAGARARAGGSGGRTMLIVKVAALVMGIAALPAAWLAWDGAQPAPPNGDDIVDTADLVPGDDDEDGRRERERVTPPPPPPPPVPPGADEGSKTQPWIFGGKPPEKPADEDPAIYAKGRLALRIRIDPPQPVAGQAFRLVAVFSNVGEGPVKFYIPEHTGHVPWPSWKLRGPAGEELVPVPRSFQSEWVHGVQGEIVRLEPGEQHRVVSDGAGFSESANSQRPLDLRPGRYAITLSLEKGRAVVPWGEPNFKKDHIEIPGLWTGEVRAEPSGFVVAPPDTPMLELDAPKTLDPAVAYAMTLDLVNPGDDALSLRGRFLLHSASKGAGMSRFAVFDPTETARPLASGTFADVELEAGEERRCRIELAQIQWKARRGHLISAPPHAVASSDYAAFWVTFEPEKGEVVERLLSNSLFRHVKAVPDLGQTGLRLGVRVEGDGSASPDLIVTLTNGGDGAVRIPTRLRFPQDVTFTIRKADAEETWKNRLTGRSRFIGPEGVSQPLTADEVELLAPHASATKRFDATDAFGSLEPGRYLLRAHWRNLDAGARESLPENVQVGHVMSDEAELTIR